jgi:hypothetical protein
MCTREAASQGHTRSDSTVFSLGSAEAAFAPTARKLAFAGFTLKR